MSDKFEEMRRMIEELSEQYCWPADLVAQAQAACDTEDAQALDAVLARLDRLRV